MYTPCVALNTVANIPYWASYLLMTALGILFTIFGNLKSAITADVIQGLVEFEFISSHRQSSLAKFYKTHSFHSIIESQ